MFSNQKSKAPNTHKKSTPDTSVDKGKKDDKKFTSYDTNQKETSSPQKVKEATEGGGEQKRSKEAK